MWNNRESSVESIRVDIEGAQGQIQDFKVPRAKFFLKKVIL